MITSAFFNRRFASSESGRDSVLSSSKDSVRAIRQSSLAALFLVLCAWLRMIRSLSWPVALLLLGVKASPELITTSVAFYMNECGHLTFCDLISII